MNQYLLLRNNRKSGPYTASELASMGLKSYDLIWLEGKSAAWRYPGEIDELKSFAPPVVEQPYDRFFAKKPETIAPSSNPSSTSYDAPKSSHIYVAVPGKTKNSTALPGQQNNTGSSTLYSGQSAMLEFNRIKEFPRRDFQLNAFSPESSAIPSYPVRPVEGNTKNINEPFRLYPSDHSISPDAVSTKKAKSSTMYWSIGLFLLFIGMTTFFYLNYLEQKKQLKKLNELVLNMHQNSSPEQSPYNKTLVANFPIDVTEPFHDSLGKTEMTLVPGTASPAAKKYPVKKKALVDTPSKAVEKKDSINTETAQQVIIPEPRPSLTKEINRNNIAQRLPLSVSKYKTGFLGGISDLKVTLANKSRVKIDKVKVLVEYLTPENKVVKTQSIDFENLVPGDTKTLEVPRTGRGSSVKCSIVSVHDGEDIITL